MRNPIREVQKTATISETTSLPQALKLAHTSDPDDAFAWWAASSGYLTISGTSIETTAMHIQKINASCLEGVYDIAAISSAAWPLFSDQYEILSAGASVGRGYGPALATVSLASEQNLQSARVAVPGNMTTAAMLLRLFFPEAITIEMPFDQIAEAILRGDVDAGVLIHEELLNYKSEGLRRLLCLGKKWQQHTNLPIPVGLNVVHRRLGKQRAGQICHLTRESLLSAFDNRDQATHWAMNYTMQAEQGIGLQFIDMFANKDTLRMDRDCALALEKLYTMAYDAELISEKPQVQFVDPAACTLEYDEKVCHAKIKACC